MAVKNIGTRREYYKDNRPLRSAHRIEARHTPKVPLVIGNNDTILGDGDRCNDCVRKASRTANLLPFDHQFSPVMGRILVKRQNPTPEKLKWAIWTQIPVLQRIPSLAGRYQQYPRRSSAMVHAVMKRSSPRWAFSHAFNGSDGCGLDGSLTILVSRRNRVTSRPAEAGNPIYRNRVRPAAAHREVTSRFAPPTERPK